MNNNKVVVPDFDFALFGSDAFQAEVEKGIVDKSLTIVSSITGFAGQLQINNVRKGSVWLNDDSNKTTFFAYEESGRVNNFPWEHRTNFPVFTFDCEVYNGDTLRAFKNFVAIMKNFESYLEEFLKNTTFDTKDGVIPQGFYGLLEYEFFRQIATTTKTITLSMALPYCLGPNNVIFLMAKVQGMEEADTLEISDILKVAKI